ncbi:MAG TPA: L,D-transpeptidase family protein [Patescibacteria group bacterium]|nr:L,D-transpeptidase family protein [Patescibacteria group bacterium]
MKTKIRKQLFVLLILAIFVGCTQNLFSPSRASTNTEVKTVLSPEREAAAFGVYRVRSGDTFYELFGPDWKKVALINRISPSALRPGMKLTVPVKPKAIQDYRCPFPKTSDRGVKFLVYLEEQALGVYNDQGDLQKWYAISSGRKGHSTPTGFFRISRKDKNHRSKTYPKPDGGTPMPYALNFYADYWIHVGKLPGRPDSHGCIRLMEDDAREIFRDTQVGDLIFIE